MQCSKTRVNSEMALTTNTSSQLPLSVDRVPSAEILATITGVGVLVFQLLPSVLVLSLRKMACQDAHGGLAAVLSFVCALSKYDVFSFHTTTRAAPGQQVLRRNRLGVGVVTCRFCIVTCVLPLYCGKQANNKRHQMYLSDKNIQVENHHSTSPHLMSCTCSLTRKQLLMLIWLFLPASFSNETNGWLPCVAISFNNKQVYYGLNRTHMCGSGLVLGPK